MHLLSLGGSRASLHNRRSVRAADKGSARQPGVRWRTYLVTSFFAIFFHETKLHITFASLANYDFTVRCASVGTGVWFLFLLVFWFHRVRAPFDCESRSHDFIAVLL